MTLRPAQPRQFTGRHMLAIMVAFFGTIIAVNVTMAIYANTSWTGLVVQNTYVASQEFNERVAVGRAQEALGWKGSLTLSGGGIRYTLVDTSGSPVAIEGVTVSFRRPAYEAEDWDATLDRTGDGTYFVQAPVRDGIWIVNTEARIADAPPYLESRRITVANGEIR